ncbi:hypothetical protein BKH20_07510 [Actinomyces oris]|uniref:Lipoprotein n=1 Tax=Actinomyces oris TaxID=544580 RepID=A0A1Q8WNX1_9ACTO|nr:hypothetical protein [Actinomyces oris]OLO69341.1 hypothetical protein BKH20_07510 [Actinomyces oris]
MKSVRTAAMLLAGLALTATPVLTACSQSTGGSSSSSSAASDSSSASDKADTKDSKKDAKADKADKADDKASASSTSSSQSDASAKPIPADSQEVSGTSVSLTFAVPKDWQDIKNLDSAEKEKVAQSMGIDAARLDQQNVAFDIVYRAKEASATGFYNNVNMASQTLPLNSTPPENEVTSLLTQQSATLTEYSTKQTATGEAAVAAYTLEVAGNTAYGTLIMVPTSKSSGGPSDYASIYVSAGSAEEAKQISNTILDTIH